MTECVLILTPCNINAISALIVMHNIRKELVMTMVCVGRNSMNLLVRPHGDALCDGHNSTNLLIRFRGGALVYIIR